MSLKFEGFFNSCQAVWAGLPDIQHLPKQVAPNFKAIIWDERSALGNSGCQPPEWGGMQFQALLWVWFPPQVQEWVGDLYHCALHIAVGCYLGQCSTGACGHKDRSGYPHDIGAAKTQPVPPTVSWGSLDLQQTTNFEGDMGEHGTCCSTLQEGLAHWWTWRLAYA